jgi:hypothetical protein
MTVEEVVRARCITEVMHFTTHWGLLGILHSGFVKPRKALPNDAELEHIYSPNAVYRKDRPWLGHVNLSISRINYEFFCHSCRWHRESDLWWCILAFDPVILLCDGVVFATTNNIYTGVKRGKGGSGLEALFATSITRWNGNIKVRDSRSNANHTTCEQAEVLYPGDLSIEHLDRIYVQNGEDEDEVHAQLSLIGRSNISVAVEPSIFKEQ